MKVNKELILEKLDLSTPKNKKKFINRSTKVLNDTGKLNKYTRSIGNNILPNIIKSTIPLVAGYGAYDAVDDAVDDVVNDQDIVDSNKLKSVISDGIGLSTGILTGMGVNHLTSFNRNKSKIKNRLMRDGVNLTSDDNKYINKQDKINRFINDNKL